MPAKHASSQQSIGTDRAIELANSGWWKSKSFRERAEFQFLTKELSMPFGVFHEAVEKTLGRPVFTHEFGLNFDGLWEELFNGKEPPSFEEILGKLPLEKTIVIVTGENDVT